MVRPIALPGGRLILSSILKSNGEAQIGLYSAVRNDPVGFRIAALHNFCLRIAQILGIKPIADARDGLLPVPSHQLFPSGGFNLHTLKGLGFPMALFFKVGILSIVIEVKGMFQGHLQFPQLVVSLGESDSLLN